MKKILLFVIAGLMNITVFATTVTYNVANTSSTTSPLNCTYSVTVDVDVCTTGNVCISLTPQTFSIAPGANHDFVFTVPAGYTVKSGFPHFTVTTSSTPANCSFNFATTDDVQQCNCYTSSNVDYVTVWTTGLGHGNGYSVRADLITH
jgi:hypothetical protein